MSSYTIWTGFGIYSWMKTAGNVTLRFRSKKSDKKTRKERMKCVVSQLFYSTLLLFSTFSNLQQKRYKTKGSTKECKTRTERNLMDGVHQVSALDCTSWECLLLFQELPTVTVNVCVFVKPTLSRRVENNYHKERKNMWQYKFNTGVRFVSFPLFQSDGVNSQLGTSWVFDLDICLLEENTIKQRSVELFCLCAPRTGVDALFYLLHLSKDPYSYLPAIR